MRLQYLIIRESVALKDLRLQHVRGHVGEPGNELADTFAATAGVELPPTPAPTLRRAWDLVWAGMPVHASHKTWIRRLVPTHSHADIHPITWRLSRRFRLWRWTLGLQWGPGFQDARTFWRNTPSPTPCPYCGTFHNQSVHGHLGLCDSPANPLVQAFQAAWQTLSSYATAWRYTASARDRFLLGKLAVPYTLFLHLQAALGPQTYRVITTFYRICPGLLRPHHQAPYQARPTRRLRLNPYVETDWSDESRKRHQPALPPRPPVRQRTDTTSRTPNETRRAPQRGPSHLGVRPRSPG